MWQFILNIKSELIKSKRSAMTRVTFIAAIFAPLTGMIVCIEKPDLMLKRMQPDFWSAFLSYCLQNMSSIVLPVYAILLVGLFVQIESRNNTYKQVYAFPRSFADIFLSKFIIINMFLMISFLLFGMFYLLFSLAINLVDSRYRVLTHSIPWGTLTVTSLRIYLGLLPLVVIQYWLSLRFKNFSLSLGIGFALWLTGVVLHDWNKIIYYPYAYPSLMFLLGNVKDTQSIHQLTLYCSLSFLAIFFLAMSDINLLKEKG